MFKSAGYDRAILYCMLLLLLSGGIMVQRLGDLEAGRRSTFDRLGRSVVEPTLTSATPGDLNLVLPYRYVTDILEMLHTMDEIAPGVASRHTLLYGVEVKFYSNRIEVSNALETKIVDTWHVTGLRGSGSHDVVARDVFVPDEYVTAVRPRHAPPDENRRPRPARCLLLPDQLHVFPASPGLARRADGARHHSGALPAHDASIGVSTVLLAREDPPCPLAVRTRAHCVGLRGPVDRRRHAGSTNAIAAHHRGAGKSLPAHVT